MDNQKSLKGNFNRILGMVSLNNFALAFVSIFIPIYLLELGYSFQMVMVWFIIHHSVLLISVFLVFRVSNRIGLVNSLHIRFALLLLYFCLFIFGLKDYQFLFFIIPVLSGAEGAFYWMPLNTLFVRNTESKSMGASLSKLFAIPKIFSIASPFIGALIAVKFGFPALFAFAMFLLMFAFLPLLPLRSEKTNFEFSWRRISQIYKENKVFLVPEIIDNLSQDALMIWTIFIYLELISVMEVGLIGTIVAIASIFFTLTIGKLTDKWNKHKLLKIGAGMVTLIWTLNFFIGEFMPTNILFYISTAFIALAIKTFTVPYISLMFNRARRDDAQFLALREIPTVLGRLILFSLAIMLHKNLPILFLLVGLIFIYFWFFDSRKLESS